jgi:hypothetical protein
MAAASVPSAGDVRALLTRSSGSRTQALAALEQAPAPIEVRTALAAAPTIVELMTASADVIDIETFCRLGLLLARLHAEALQTVESICAIYAAAFGGRLALVDLLLDAPDNVLARALGKPVKDIGEADARAFVSLEAHRNYIGLRGFLNSFRAIQVGTHEHMKSLFARHPLWSQLKLPDGVKARKLLRLFVELLRAKQIQSVGLEQHVDFTAAVWSALSGVINGRLSVARLAVESSIFELAVSTLRNLGRPTTWLRVSNAAGLASALLETASVTIKAFGAERERPDKEALISSGLFDECIAAVQALSLAGNAESNTQKQSTGGSSKSVVRFDTAHSTLYHTLSRIRDGVEKRPPFLSRFCPEPVLDHQFHRKFTPKKKCLSRVGLDMEGSGEKIRRISSALAFCLVEENDCKCLPDIGYTTAATAANICAGVFGRDDGETSFLFTQNHVDIM